jgi:hypothetical protein
MADKEVHVHSNGGGSLGVIAGILAVVLIALGLIYVFAIQGDEKTADLNIEVPKIDAPKVDAPKVDAPKVDVPGVGEGR